jgi:hypothetical protein
LAVLDKLAILLAMPFAIVLFSRFNKFYNNACYFFVPIYLLCLFAARNMRKKGTMRASAQVYWWHSF